MARRIGYDRLDPISTFERFYHNLPAWPHCMAGLNQPSYRLPKDRAICFPYIQMNKLRRAYICLDVDRPGAALCYKEVGMPAPTFTLENPENGHAHVFYESKNPIPFTGKSRVRPQNYYRAVEEALIFQFQADLSFSAYIVKNPYHNTRRGGGKWELVNNCITYDLKDLASYVDLRSYKRRSVKRKLQSVAGPILEGARNDSVFDLVRTEAYRTVKYHKEYGTFHHELRVYSVSLNQQYCIPPLPLTELEYMLERICDWTWQNRLSLGKHLFKNKGVMGFEPISPNLELSERQAEIRRREREGANYTHSLRKRRTEEAIVEAIEQLKTQGKRVTKTAVASVVGIRRETVSRNYKHLFES